MLDLSNLNFYVLKALTIVPATREAAEEALADRLDNMLDFSDFTMIAKGLAFAIVTYLFSFSSVLETAFARAQIRLAVAFLKNPSLDSLVDYLNLVKFEDDYDTESDFR